METKTLPTWQDQHWVKVAILLGELKKAVDSSMNGKRMVKEARDFLTYLWENNITQEARLAVIDVLLQASKGVGKPWAEWTSERRKRSEHDKRTHRGKAGVPRELLQLVPTTHKLLKAARQANPQQEWTLKLPQEIFRLAIDDLVAAARDHGKKESTSVLWKVRIKASDIFRGWDDFDAQQQVMLLDFTSSVTAKIDDEFARHAKQRYNFFQEYPEAVDYEAALLKLSVLRYPSQNMAAEGPAYHGVATAAVTGGPFQAQQRGSTNAMVFAPNGNGTLPPSNSFAYGIANHPVPPQRSQPFDFAAYPHATRRQAYPHSISNAQTTFDPNSVATLPLRSFPTQGADPYSPFPHNPSAALHPSYASPHHLSTNSNPPPQQLAFNPNFVQRGQIQYPASYLAPVPLHTSYPVPAHPSSTHPQSYHQSTPQDFSNYSSYPPNSQFRPPSNPHTHPRQPRHR